MKGRDMDVYHVPEADLAAYAQERLDDASAWSVEAHLDGCDRCRSRVVPGGVPAAIVAAARPGGAALPAQGRVRAATRRRKVALLIGAGPGARLAWLCALAVTVLLATAVASRSGGQVPSWLLLIIAPVLPVLGTALSYGPHTDPLHELVGSTAYGGLRILLWRTVSVLIVSVPVTVVAGFASQLGTPVLWLLPSAALTALTLALAGAVEPARAATLVGAGWTVLVLASTHGEATGGVLVAASTSPLWGALTVTATALVLFHSRRQEGYR